LFTISVQGVTKSDTAHLKHLPSVITLRRLLFLCPPIFFLQVWCVSMESIDLAVANLPSSLTGSFSSVSPAGFFGLPGLCFHPCCSFCLRLRPQGKRSVYFYWEVTKSLPPASFLLVFSLPPGLEPARALRRYSDLRAGQFVFSIREITPRLGGLPESFSPPSFFFLFSGNLQAVPPPPLARERPIFFFPVVSLSKMTADPLLLLFLPFFILPSEELKGFLSRAYDR